MSTDDETAGGGTAIDHAGHHVLEMFAAVCGAPDDAAVAARANQALRDLESLLSDPPTTILAMSRVDEAVQPYPPHLEDGPAMYRSSTVRLVGSAPRPGADLARAEQAAPDPVFYCLGMLECRSHDGRIVPGGAAQRTLLAALLTAESQALSNEALVDELWGEQPPARTTNALHAHVSRLRRTLLGVGDASVCELSRTPVGYRLRTAAGAVDAVAFTEAVEEVNSTSMDVATAVGRLRRALAMWSGPVFGGPLGGSLCQAAVARYEAVRMIAYESLFDLELRRGRHAELIPEISGLLGSSSLNERFCGQLMVALYRSGRQAEALDAYSHMRLRLDSDLGVLPSPALRKHQQAILTHDPVLHSDTVTSPYGPDRGGEPTGSRSPHVDGGAVGECYAPPGVRSVSDGDSPH